MRFKYKIFLLIFPILLFGCSHRESGIDITLPNDKHLEEIIAGAWIKVFNLDYENDSRYITYKIHEKLMANSESLPKLLLDKYFEKKYSMTSVWELSITKHSFNDNKQLILYANEYGKLIIYETLTESIQPSITLKLNPPGLPWIILIPDQYEMLKPNRKYEHAVTITSKADIGARLFLFGWGNYCTEITLF